MNNLIRAPFPKHSEASVVALHCSLGSGRQWAKLAEELRRNYLVITPDISGYGTNTCALELPLTLAEEVRCLSGHLNDATGPIHLIGHSYGGAIAFKIATASPFAHRIRSLTLIEPVLPTLLRENKADRRLHDRFEQLSLEISADLWNGSILEAIDKFTEFWNGSGPREPLAANARLRMIERAEKLAFDFSAALAEENVSAAAVGLRMPTLLFSGGLSPYLTQRITGRLASIIGNAQMRHLPAAGHMLPLTHAAIVNPEIVKHIARADELAELTLAAGELPADVIAFAREVSGDRSLPAWLACGRSDIHIPEPGTKRRWVNSPRWAFRQNCPPSFSPAFRLYPCCRLYTCCPLASHAALAAEETEAAPKGAAVTVLKAAKACFANTVEVSGQHHSARRDPGAARADGAEGRRSAGGCRRYRHRGSEFGAVEPAGGRPGDRASAGGGAGLGLERGGRARRPRPRANRCSPSSRGASSTSSAWCATRDIAKLAVNQTARIKVIGAGDVDGRVRRLSTTVRAQQPARPGVRRHHHQPPPAGEFVRAGADQNRPKLRRVGAAHRYSLWHRRHRGAGGSGASASRRGGWKPG